MKKILLAMAFMVVSFWSGAQTRNVTFRVDMSTYTGTFTTPEVNGTWNSWCGNCNAMSPTSTPGVWSVTLPLAQGTALEYKFSHDNWAGQEMNNPAGSCTNGNAQFTNRVFTVPAFDTILPVVCWGSCGPCGSQPTTANVTFRVDMSTFTGTFTRPEINGTFNSWCGNCAPMSDANNDNIWDITVNLPIGDTIEYKFSHDNWAGQETNNPAGACTNGNQQFTNRVLVIRGDTTMPAVCWGSCLPCGQSSNVNELSLQPMKLFPNPAQGVVTLESALAGSVRVLDIAGRTVLSSAIEAGENRLAIDQLQRGVYLVQLSTDKGTQTERLVVR
jgi:hypothetical protein